MAACYHFASFSLDPEQRRLTEAGRAVDVSGRYFDALHLMVREAGNLVSKERFHAEVWKNIPVTDEALTQCVRTLRRALGDTADAPRFIETVQRHGYRFIAAVERDAVTERQSPVTSLLERLSFSIAGAIGGGAAGLAGGAFYASSGLVAAPIGAASTLLAFMSLCLLLGVIGGAAVGLGLAFSDRVWWHKAIGGLCGGAIVGAFSSVVGNDLFMLLLGRAPERFTGLPDSAAVGLAVGISLALAEQASGKAVAARLGMCLLIGATTGLIIALAGGRLLAGSLVELSAAFPESPLRLDGLVALGLPFATAFECALFVAFVTAGLMIRRRLVSARV